MGMPRSVPLTRKADQARSCLSGAVCVRLSVLSSSWSSRAVRGIRTTAVRYVRCRCTELPLSSLSSSSLLLLVTPRVFHLSRDTNTSSRCSLCRINNEIYSCCFEPEGVSASTYIVHFYNVWLRLYIALLKGGIADQ